MQESRQHVSKRKTCDIADSKALTFYGFINLCYMKIFVAKNSGFCPGVRRAVEMVLDASAKQKNPVYTYGPLIHNAQVLKVLEEKGIQVLDKIPDNATGTVLIRAHGVPAEIKAKLKRAGFSVLDATCPRVIKIQTIIQKYARRGYASIIIGDKNHAEVIGLLGHAAENGYVVGSLEGIKHLPTFEKAIVVVQTTQNMEVFQTLKAWADANFPHYRIFDTICDSTERRQSEVKQLAEDVDAVVVVGGQQSANTQRLFEIAKQTGKPAFHIETAEDIQSLDLDLLTSVTSIGITAGASTPNWIIKKVYRALEELPYKHKRSWHTVIFSVQQMLLLTNVYLAVGAGCLTYACSKLQGIGDYLPFIFLSILYVQSMHILNHLTGQKENHYNDPERANFYNNNKIVLVVLAITSGGAGMLIAYMLGPEPFAILLVMSILGLSYNLRLLPKSFDRLKYQRIRDLPGSKTFLIAIAWGILTAILPPLSTKEGIAWNNILIFLWSANLVLVRTAFFDILDIQGDRIVGKETIAILLGEKKCLRLLQSILIILVVIFPLASAFQFIPSLGFALTLCPILFLLVIAGFQRRVVIPGIKLEFWVETHLIATGIITYIWP